MKVAVTGGSGQLGTLILRRLLDDRAVREVVCLDLVPPLLVGRKLRFVRVDVRDPGIGAHLAGCDALIHLAFVVTRRKPRAEADAINVGGSENVFGAAARAGVRTILHASSIAAYGVVDGHGTLSEDTPRRRQPDFFYAAGKFDVEALLDRFEPGHPSIRVVRLRPSILVGARMDHPLGGALRRRVMPDGGDVPMPIVWDEDVADAFLLALRREDARGAFVLSAEELVPPAELARAAGLRLVKMPMQVIAIAAPLSAAASRLGIGPDVDPAWLRVREARMIPSSARARTVLGWKPSCPTAIAVMRRFVETVPRRLDPRIGLFLSLVELGMRDRRRRPRELEGVTSRTRLVLTGEGGGEVGLLVENGRFRFSRRPPRPPTSVVTLPAATLRDLLSGRDDFTSAQFTGRIRIEGEPFAGFLLGGMSATLARWREGRGLPRVLARAFARSLGGDG